MSSRYDPHERRRPGDTERERQERDIVEYEARSARGAGDPRWGTGGMVAEEDAGHAVVRDTPPSGVAWGHPKPSRGLRDPRGPYVGYGPRGYRRSDERIREDVCDRFTEDGYLDATDVEVTVVNGEVTLVGTVATRAQKRLAEDIAESVSGVVEVQNHVHVQRWPTESRQPAGHPATNAQDDDVARHSHQR